jgi:DNA-binding CsgD family transcriptional regulator
MSKLRPGDLFVAICDWNGIIQWMSTDGVRTKVGMLGWSHLIPEDAEKVKIAISRTVTLNERHVVEVRSDLGNRYRIWMWPIGTPELAVCSFNLMIPSEVSLLTDRETEFMRELGAGQDLKSIAARMDISINTAHTYMRHVREKLGLQSPQEAIVFAARFFAPIRNADIGKGLASRWSTDPVPSAKESRKKIRTAPRIRRSPGH